MNMANSPAKPVVNYNSIINYLDDKYAVPHHYRLSMDPTLYDYVVLNCGVEIKVIDPTYLHRGRALNTGPLRIGQTIMACHNLIFQLLNGFIGNITANKN